MYLVDAAKNQPLILNVFSLSVVNMLTEGAKLEVGRYSWIPNLVLFLFASQKTKIFNALRNGKLCIAIVKYFSFAKLTESNQVIYASFWKRKADGGTAYYIPRGSGISESHKRMDIVFQQLLLML